MLILYRITLQCLTWKHLIVTGINKFPEISGKIRINRLVIRTSVKLFESGVRTPGGLFLAVWYAGGIDFRRFHAPSLWIFGVIFGLLEASKMALSCSSD